MLECRPIMKMKRPILTMATFMDEIKPKEKPPTIKGSCLPIEVFIAPGKQFILKG